MRPGQPPRRRHGLTLVELMITLTIGAILLALAVPQMREYIARKRVSGTAAELASDIRLARAMVTQQNQPIWVNFSGSGDFTCYVIFTEGGQTGGCDCARTATPMCDAVLDPPIPLRSVFIQRSTGITLTSTSANVGFTQAVGAPRLRSGTGQVEINGGIGGQLRINLAGLTRATVCSVSGHTAEFGDCL